MSLTSNLTPEEKTSFEYYARMIREGRVKQVLVETHIKTKYTRDEVYEVYVDGVLEPTRLVTHVTSFPSLYDRFVDWYRDWMK